MKLHIFMYLINIAKDLKLFAKNFRMIKTNKFLFYGSEIIEKVELSLEMIYEVIYGEKKDVDLFERKKLFLLLLELIRMGFKFRELKSLEQIGYDFYVEKNIYLEHVVELTDEDFSNKFNTIK